MEFRFRTAFQSEVVFLAVRDNLLHHRAHLVHLDGVDDEMLPFVVIFLFCLCKASGSLFDAVVQDVGKAQQYGCRNVGIAEVFHYVCEVNLHIVLLRTYIGMTFIIDAEVVDSPSFDVVQFFGVFDSPLSHGLLLRFLCVLGCLGTLVVWGGGISSDSVLAGGSLSDGCSGMAPAGCHAVVVSSCAAIISTTSLIFSKLSRMSTLMMWRALA